MTESEVCYDIYKKLLSFLLLYFVSLAHKHDSEGHHTMT